MSRTKTLVVTRAPASRQTRHTPVGTPRDKTLLPERTLCDGGPLLEEEPPRKYVYH